MLGKLKVAPAMIGSFAFGPRGARKDAGRLVRKYVRNLAAEKLGWPLRTCHLAHVGSTPLGRGPRGDI